MHRGAWWATAHGVAKSRTWLRQLSMHKGKPGIQLRNLPFFYIWGDTCLWAHWIHSFHIYLSYLGPILVHLASCIPSAPQQSPWGVTASLDRSFGSPHSHLEARNYWWLWHFLFINMAGDIFISQYDAWQRASDWGSQQVTRHILLP